MNSQDLRNLQEAYLDVYQELDEEGATSAELANFVRQKMDSRRDFSVLPQAATSLDVLMNLETNAKQRERGIYPERSSIRRGSGGSGVPPRSLDPVRISPEERGRISSREIIRRGDEKFANRNVPLTRREVPIPVTSRSTPPTNNPWRSRTNTPLTPNIRDQRAAEAGFSGSGSSPKGSKLARQTERGVTIGDDPFEVLRSASTTSKSLPKPKNGVKGQSSSSAGAGSASGTTGRDQYKVGGGEGYGVLGIKLANSYEPDLYDVILEYLLDEGYADTQESALAIMANMTEEWIESICEDVTYLEVAMGEGKVPWNDPNRPLQSGHTPAEKNRAKRARTGVEDPNKSQMDISDKDMIRYGGMKTADDTETSKAPKQKKTLFGKPKPLEHETPPHEFKKDRKLDPKQTGNEYSMNKYAPNGNATSGQARRAVGANFAGYRDGDSSIFPTPIKQGDTRRRTSKKWGGPNPRTPKPEAPRRKTTINASYEPDLYDVILEYLLDEGYADTQEAALAIMGNMSEDWRESIAENVTSGKSRVKNVPPKPTGLISNSEIQSTIQSRIEAENKRITDAGNAAHETATSKGLSPFDAQTRRKAAELRSKREIAKSYR